MIKFENVTKSFQEDFWKQPKKALDNLSFEIASGRVTGFLGRNGAGKTTSIKIMLEFIKADSGRVHYSPELGKNMREIKSNIGYLPERPYFYPDLKGREFIKLLLNLSGKKLRNHHQDLKLWSEKLKIDHALDQKIRGYSKGMLQRLGFISAIIHDPKFIIMDEPLSGLDPIGRHELKTAIMDLKDLGKTIFFSSHIVQDLEEVSEDILLIQDGKFLKGGPLIDLVKVDSNICEVFLGSEVNNLPVEVIEERHLDGQTMVIVNKENKEKLIRYCLEQSIEVMSLKTPRPTLEELTYGEHL